MAIDLTVFVENKPGQLAAIGEATGEVGANLAGCCRGRRRLVVRRTDRRCGAVPIATLRNLHRAGAVGWNTTMGVTKHPERRTRWPLYVDKPVRGRFPCILTGNLP